MMSPDSPSLRPAHPLALALIDRLRDRAGARVLEIGTGSGRNTRALIAAGFAVTSVADGEPIAGDDLPFAGALSTHALLHGTSPTIAQMLAQIAQRLEGGAPLYATFGSVHDARFGVGARIEERTYTPIEGDERGVPHTFFDESGLRELLATHFTIDRIEERDVDEVVGRWAHREPLRESVHWFVHARAR